MTVTADLLANNARYAATFGKGDLPLPPGLGLAVVACMDARLDPHRLLGISEGDAHVIRNAGGVVTDDAIRSLTLSQRLLGTTSIILIHHTDCGMLTFPGRRCEGRNHGGHGFCGRHSRWRRSAILRGTCGSRLRESRQAPSFPIRAMCVGSCTTARRGS